MANKKVVDLTELTTPASGDYLHIVDVSDTTNDPSGTSKKIEYSTLISSSFSAYTTVGTSNDADYVCDGTADDVQIQAAITAAASGTGVVLIQKGTYYLTAPLTIPDNVNLMGVRRDSSSLVAADTIDSMIITTGTNVKISDLGLYNASSYATRGVYVQNSQTELTNLHIGASDPTGFPYGVYVATTDNSQLNGLRIHGGLSFSNTYGIYLANNVLNSTISNIYSQGETAIYMTQSTAQCEGITISNCKILPNVTSATSKRGIHLDAGLEIQIIGNIIDQVGGDGVYISSAVGNCAFIKVIGNWIGGNADIADTSGVAVYGAGSRVVSNVVIQGNTLASCSYYGIRWDYVNGVVNTKGIIDGNVFLSNTTGDILVNKGTLIKIIGNSCPHSTYPLREVDNGSTCVVMGNNFAVTPTKSTGSTYLNNFGDDL